MKHSYSISGKRYQVTGLSALAIIAMLSGCQKPDNIQEGTWNITTRYSDGDSTAEIACLKTSDIMAYNGRGFYGRQIDKRCKIAKLTAEDGEIEIREDCTNVNTSVDPDQTRMGYATVVVGTFDRKSFQYTISTTSPTGEDLGSYAKEGEFLDDDIGKCLADKEQEEAARMEREFNKVMNRANQVSRDYNRALRGDFSW
jgi:hypothetical protein